MTAHTQLTRLAREAQSQAEWLEGLVNEQGNQYEERAYRALRECLNHINLLLAADVPPGV